MQLNNPIYIIGATLINGDGAPPQPKTTVVIHKKKISAIGSQNEIKPQPNCLCIDANGLTLMPGLIDSHVHLSCGRKENIFWNWGTLPPLLENSLPTMAYRAAERAKRSLYMGYTTLRDVGDIGYVTVALRDAINEGIVEGPRISASGPYLNTSAGHGYAMPPWLKRTDLFYPGADGADGVLKAVRQSIKMNVDWIKICATGGVTTNAWDKQQFNDLEIKTLVDEAHDKGRPVSAHCVWAKGGLACARLGIDTLEHGTELNNEIVELMIEKDIYLVPTLYVMHSLAEEGQKLGFSPERTEIIQKAAEMHRESFQLALKSGVNIANGYDAGWGPLPIHGTNAKELEILVKYGMTPMQAIVAATSQAAQALKLGKSTGSIAIGKLADLIIIKGDPIDDIRILQDEARIGLVMMKGNVIVNRL